MNAQARECRRRRSAARVAALLLVVVVTSAPAWSACPKLLMTAGLNIHKQTNPQQAAYWGQTVGLQGFMVNYIVTDWDTDVGTNPDNGTWKLLKRFQSIYAQHGVTDNFIKIALYSGHDWHSAKQNADATRNLAHAAALAKYAGLKGLALDLEPYKPAWAGGPQLAKTVEQEGRRMGEAMHKAYPGMTLIVLPDVLREAEYEAKLGSDWARQHHGGYELAAPFVRGLLAVPWSHVVIATEFTYSAHADRLVQFVHEAAQRYQKAMGPGDQLGANFSVAPGLWPLGPNSTDKSPRETPDEFKRRLKAAFDNSRQYVWIFGSNSAWQKDGPLGPIPGPVTTGFPKFLDAIHDVRASCSASGGRATAHFHGNPGQPPFSVIPAKTGLRRQDAGANIGEADGPNSRAQERLVTHFQPSREQFGSRLSPG